tara:strand:- start:1369 stop:1701 length:333 start_codon:yes stop_codon:yes gene_type:complete
MAQWKVRSKFVSKLDNETWSVDSWKQKHFVDALGADHNNARRALGTDNNLYGSSTAEWELIDNVMHCNQYFASEGAYHDLGTRVSTYMSDNSLSYPFTREIITQGEVADA